MENFVYNPQTKIIFGRETEATVGKELKCLLSEGKVLVHYGSERIKTSGLFQTVVDSLTTEGFDYVELGGVQANPRLSLVKEGIELCRREEVKFILAVGGGSVIDSAKGIALGICAGDDFWQKYYVDMEPVTEAIPIGTILTIPAAGSESSPGTVVTDEETERKLYAIGDVLRPKFSILNPELSLSLPKYQVACGAVDMLAHVMERYFTKAEHVDFTDKLCEGAMRSIIKNGTLSVEKPDNYDYRAELMLAGMMAHNDVLGLGRIGDWMTHDIEHELSAIWDVTHGEGLAILFPAWIKYVYKECPQRFVQFAEEVFGMSEGSDEEKILASVSALQDWYRSLGVATTLSELSDVDSSKFALMAERVVGESERGHVKSLNKEAVIKIFEYAS